MHLVLECSRVSRYFDRHPTPVPIPSTTEPRVHSQPVLCVVMFSARYKLDNGLVRCVAFAYMFGSDRRQDCRACAAPLWLRRYSPTGFIYTMYISLVHVLFLVYTCPFQCFFPATHGLFVTVSIDCCATTRANAVLALCRAQTHCQGRHSRSRHVRSSCTQVSIYTSIGESSIRNAFSSLSAFSSISSNSATSSDCTTMAPPAPIETLSFRNTAVLITMLKSNVPFREK